MRSHPKEEGKDTCEGEGDTGLTWQGPGNRSALCPASQQTADSFRLLYVGGTFGSETFAWGELLLMFRDLLAD